MTGLTARGRSSKKGLPPGTLVHIGSPSSAKVSINIIDYDEQSLNESRIVEPHDCCNRRSAERVTWIDVDGIHDVAVVQSLGEQLGLHPLVMEDILNTAQRPKQEDYGHYLYIVMKMLRWDDEHARLDVEQVSLVLGRGYVISFQERPGDVFEPVRQRLRTNKGRVRRMGADYLAYSLLDAVVDGYFSVLEQLGDRIEALQENIIQSPQPELMHDLHDLKRDGLLLRRSIWPMRELLSSLWRGESSLIERDIGIYLRDVYDHSVGAMDTLETFREMLSGLHDTYLSGLSHRMNEVMKVLTIIATLFIPVTFISGVYGMNFQHMPELAQPWAYPAALGLMGGVMIGMVIYFRRKKWL